MASQIRFSWSLQLWFPNGLCLTTLPFWWPVYIKTWWIISFSNKISSRHGYTDSSVREFNTKWRTFSFGVQTVKIILKIPSWHMMPVKKYLRQYVLVSPIFLSPDCGCAGMWGWQTFDTTSARSHGSPPGEEAEVMTWKKWETDGWLIKTFYGDSWGRRPGPQCSPLDIMCPCYVLSPEIWRVMSSELSLFQLCIKINR